MRGILFALTLSAATGILLFGAPLSQASAGGEKLTAAEITALLTNRTALSQNRGQATRQSFSESGVTFYAEGNSPKTRGYWRADEKLDQYCSNWPPAGGWSCYDIVRDPEAGEGHYRWQSANGYDEPFTLRDGKSLSFD